MASPASAISPMTDCRQSVDQITGHSSSNAMNVNDRILNFSTAMMDDYQPPIKRIKTVRDPVSHRIIEKRRRDRMNNCLAELSNLLPARYLNKGQGRIEKTEIIELATHHIKHLNSLIGSKSKQSKSPECCHQSFFMGFKECGAEVMRFLVECAGTNPQDNLCVQLRQHLSQQSKKFCVPEITDDQEIEGKEMKEGSYQHSVAYSDSGFSDSTVLQTTLLDKSQEARLRGLLSNQMEEESNDDGRAWNLCNQPQYRDNQNMMSGSDTAESVSNMTSSDDASMNKCKEIYKFKNNIKLRFSADSGNSQSGQSDFLVSPSPQDSESNSDAKFSSSPSSESTAYPSSDYSSVNGSGNSSSDTSSHRKDSGSSKSSMMKGESREKFRRSDSYTTFDSDPPVPGFALHPSATHYIPIAIPSSSLFSILDGRSLTSNNIFHPISIPVQFSPTLTCQKNINVAFQ